MDLARLNSRVVIQQASTAQDDFGQPSTSWADVATTWADIRYLSGLETIKGDAFTSSTKCSVRMRYRTDVVAGMRIVHNLVNYGIRAVLPDLTDKQYVTFACEVVT